MRAHAAGPPAEPMESERYSKLASSIFKLGVGALLSCTVAAFNREHHANFTFKKAHGPALKVSREPLNGK